VWCSTTVLTKREVEKRYQAQEDEFIGTIGDVTTEHIAMKRQPKCICFQYTLKHLKLSQCRIKLHAMQMYAGN
jgi:hypothetical protein